MKVFKNIVENLVGCYMRKCSTMKIINKNEYFDECFEAMIINWLYKADKKNDPNTKMEWKKSE